MASGPIHFEGFHVGDRFETLGRTVSEYEILSFVTLVGMNEALFMDAEYITRDTPFGRRIAPGALVFSYAEGLVIQTGHLHGSAIAFLGAEMKMQGPVYLGDTIEVNVSLAQRRKTQGSGPSGRGKG